MPKQEQRTRIDENQPPRRHLVGAMVVLILGTGLSLAGGAGAAPGGRDPDQEPPSAPANVRVTEATPTSVSLAWDESTDNVGVVGYLVEVDGRRAKRGSAPAYTVDGLQCGQIVTVLIAAFDRSRNRSEQVSATVSAAACPDTQPPSTPTGLTVTARTVTTITLAWSPATDNVGVQGYDVSVDGVARPTTNQPATTLSDLACGRTYAVTVRAYDAAGNRSSTATVNAGTAACPPTSPPADTAPPSQPGSLTASNVTATSLTLGWTASTDNVGVTGYDIYRNGTRVGSATSNSYGQSGLTCATSYAFAVIAYDAAGNRSPQAQLTAATAACASPADTAPPSQPGSLTASNVTATSLTLGWTASTDNVGVTGYDIYRNGTRVGSATSNSYGQSGLTCATSYAFAVIAYDAAGNRSPQAQLTAATAACASPPAAGVPTLEQVDGGPGYYGQFSNPLPSDPSYFPIGVWGTYSMTQANIDLDKDVGLNLYVWIDDPQSANLAGIRAAGMHVLHLARIQAQFSNKGSESVGYVLEDEIDMVQANAAGAAAARTQLTNILAGLPNDGRARYSNYGKGVAYWNSNSDAEQYVNDFQQLVSVDVYWFTDPGGACTQWEGGRMFTNATRALTAAECRRASNYGAVVERMRFLDAMDGRRMPIWNFVEVGTPFSNGGTITAPQIRAAVWHSIISGARGILYFQHSFGGSCISHNSLRDSCGAAVRPMVKSVNAQIKALAPVLNAPTVTSGWTTGSTTKATVKWQGGHFYLFAGSANNVSSTSSFSIPCVGNATATVLGENRTVPVSGGSFSDSFADGNAVHIYRIDGGSSCGLT